MISLCPLNSASRVGVGQCRHQQVSVSYLRNAQLPDNKRDEGAEQQNPEDDSGDECDVQLR